MADDRTVAVVTGGNQGLGLALVRGLCRQLGGDAVVHLAARDRTRGEQAVEQLRSEGLSPQLTVLDVREPDQVDRCAASMYERHGGVDVVISNAAARRRPDRSDAETVREFIDTNNHGTYRMITAFAPILRANARLLVIASAFGTLRYLPEALHSKFDTDTASMEDIEAIMDDYVHVVETGRAAEQGWPASINVASKVAQVASLRIAARIHRETARARGILLNAACPGLIDTDASRPWFADMSQAQTPDEAARDVLWLATRPAGTVAPYGELVQHKVVLPFRGTPLAVTNRTDG